MARVTRILVATFVLVVPAVLLAADPPAGSYKIMLPLQGGEQPLWLLKLESKEGKLTGTATPGPEVPAAKVDGLTLDKGTLTFTLTLEKAAFPFEVRTPAKDGKLFGTVTMQGTVNPAILEATTLPSLDPFDVSRELLAKSKNDVELFQAAMICLSKAAANKAKTDEVKTWAATALKTAEPFGPKWKRLVILQLAEILGSQEGFTGLALDYAEQAEKLLDASSDSPILQKRVLTLYADALDKAGRKEDAKKVRDRGDKLSALVVKKYAGRKAKSDRVALVELFSSCQQPGCVAPDTAFAALLPTYTPAEVVLLQYHVNSPGPDPLANADSEARTRFYEARGTPHIFFNGREANAGAGGAADGQACYEQYTEALGKLLETPTKLRLTASAARKGSTIDIKTDVADLQEVGRDVRLRIALVEDEVTYTGRNGVAKHVHVVRHFPDGAGGKPMLAKTSNSTTTVDLEEVKKSLKAYLEKVNEATPFPNKDRPLDLKKLSVIVFVQNDETGEVLNAVQVAVKGE
jgi:hypothetical protein